MYIEIIFFQILYWNPYKNLTNLILSKISCEQISMHEWLSTWVFKGYIFLTFIQISRGRSKDSLTKSQFQDFLEPLSVGPANSAIKARRLPLRLDSTPFTTKLEKNVHESVGCHCEVWICRQPWLMATFRHSTTVTSTVNALLLGSLKEHYLVISKMSSSPVWFSLLRSLFGLEF